MRRRKGDLLPNEIRILGTALALRDEKGRRLKRFHGFEMLRQLAEQEGGSLLNHSTLYRALRRLEEKGLFESEWSDEADSEAASVSGPRRRYYQLTEKGREVALEAVTDIAVDRRPAWAAPLARRLKDA